MIRGFRDRATEALFAGGDPSDYRRLPSEIRDSAKRKLIMLAAAASLSDLRQPPGNRLEALKGKLTGRHSIRVNDQWRVVFRWEGADAVDVEIVDYH